MPILNEVQTQKKSERKGQAQRERREGEGEDWRELRGKKGWKGEEGMNL